MKVNKERKPPREWKSNKQNKAGERTHKWVQLNEKDWKIKQKTKKSTMKVKEQTTK